jgi:hypothetical protein
LTQFRDCEIRNLSWAVASKEKAVYLGYTNGRENLALLGEPAILARTRNPDLQTAAQVFVKVSYLFRF